ncbi:cysteine proteinase [Hesseltinella vesiculosa]|uniref:ubiquitinyl hydrolase 1 n=1 Tax=Hesseltinella vesiculosa TaxID=101127 RepID=A0A1X2G2S4_9FUNG|nr:cysteine proteinase [Hesseltinella vesiculosa]
MTIKDLRKLSLPQLTPDSRSNSSPAASLESSLSPKQPKPVSVKDDNVFHHLLHDLPDLETEQEFVYHWTISDWKGLETKAKSPKFQVGPYSWRILLFPKGNNQHDYISVYLEVADPAQDGHPDDWHACAQFSLVIWAPNDPTNYYNNQANHRFTSEEVDWGFTRFHEIKALSHQSNNGKGPFLISNSLTISVFVRLVKDDTGVLWHTFVNYDSRKETGYVGMKNQGATCYMNSLLQSLYCTNLFRKAVYEIPTENDEPTNSVSLALQRCFYNLQYEELPVGTTELTKSFGWDSLDAFMQHDVQEFNRVLQDNLEMKMKGTPADGAISKLFLGKMKSYIKCIDVDYESSRTEDFYDIQLNVKGCKDLHESFQDYVAIETLEGENKYQAEGYGLQDAKKGVIFEEFPPVLHLQLKRFEYDMLRDTMVKINDRHEFPEEICLDQYVSDKADAKDAYDYVLHGVLVHSGDLHSGHYFALIKPEKDGKWLRFDDDRVTPVTKKEVLEENFGDDPRPVSAGGPPSGGPLRSTFSRMMKRFTNAYMLVYIRKNKLDEVLGSISDDDIPNHLKKRLNEERAAQEKRRKDREEMHLYVKAAIITDESFKDWQRFDLTVFDDRALTTAPGIQVLKMLKTDTVSAFKDQVSKHYNLDKSQFRLWSIVCRANETLRVDKILTAGDDNISMEKQRDHSCHSSQFNGFAKFFLETTPPQSKASLPELKPDSLLVFLKYFNPMEQTITGLGHIFVSPDERVDSIRPQLLERAGLPPNQSLEFYEEVKMLLIEPMAPKSTFKSTGIQSGDIICFQRPVSESLSLELYSKNQCPNVREYYKLMYNQVLVQFKEKTEKRDSNGGNGNVGVNGGAPGALTTNGDTIQLILNREATYDQVARELGHKLGCVSSKIRLTTANPVTKQPKEVIHFRSNMQLEEMARGIFRAQEYAHAVTLETLTPIPLIYYEVLDVSMAVLENQRSLQVTLLGPGGIRDETTLTLNVPRVGSVSSLVPALVQSKKCKIDVSAPERLRFFESVGGRITKEFSLDQPIDNVSENVPILYIERIPDEEHTMDLDEDRLIQVVHYNKDPTRLHSVPFRFTVKKGEPFGRAKQRLQKRLGISGKVWQQIKFTVIKNITALDPEVIALDKDELLLQDFRIGENDALGLDHVDKSSKTSRFGAFERGIFIRG